jgi:hypothetical protein
MWVKVVGWWVIGVRVWRRSVERWWAKKLVWVWGLM